jgi:hypothetical protein
MQIFLDLLASKPRKNMAPRNDTESIGIYCVKQTSSALHAVRSQNADKRAAVPRGKASVHTDMTGECVLQAVTAGRGGAMRSAE